MASRFALIAILPLVALACATGESSPNPDEPPGNLDASADAPAITDAGRDAARADAGDATLPSPADAGDAGDVGDAADATVPPLDSGPDAGHDAAIDAGSDAAIDGGSCVPFDAGACSGIVNVCGTATATSTYVGPLTTYSASRVIDGDPDTSWFAATNACPGNTCAGNVSVTVTLRQLQTIGRVKLFANGEFPTDYEIMTARIDLLDANDAVLRQVNVTRGTSPATTIDQVISPAQACVRKVRVVPLTGKATGPGFAELEIHPN